MQYVKTRTHARQTRQFTCVHVAKCHSTTPWILSSYFPMTASRQQYVHRQRTIDTTVPIPRRGTKLRRGRNNLISSRIMKTLDTFKIFIILNSTRMRLWATYFFKHNLMTWAAIVTCSRTLPQKSSNIYKKSCKMDKYYKTVHISKHLYSKK